MRGEERRLFDKSVERADTGAVRRRQELMIRGRFEAGRVRGSGGLVTMRRHEDSSRVMGCVMAIGLVALADGCASGSGNAAVADAGSDAGVDAAGRLADARAALKPLADAACTWIFRCCNADERALQVGAATPSNCSELLLQNEALGQLGGYGQTLGVSASAQSVLTQLDHVAAVAGRTTVSPAAMSACAQSIAQASCTPPAASHCTSRPPSTSGDPCDPQKVLVGEQPLGRPCDSSGYECTPGLTCTNPGYDVQGVCVPEPAAGDLCVTDGACGPGFVCDWSSSTCVKGAAYGAPCSFADPSNPLAGTEKARCQVGLECDAVSFTCVESGCAAGGSCSIDTQCPVGTKCLSSSCTMPAQPGQPCMDNLGCAGGFCLNNTCVSGVCSESMCFEGPGVGAACTLDTDCQPSGGLLCGAGKCALTTPPNASCNLTTQTCDSSSYCALATGLSTGGCLPKKPAGALCKAYGECWGDCLVVFGEERCIGSAPGDAMCHGS